MRIRFVRPEFWADDVIAEDLGWAERGFFIALWNYADDAGVFEWKPKTIKRVLAAADDEPVAPMMDRLADVGMLKRYAVDGREYGAIRNFCKWQKPRFPSYAHPRTAEIDAFVQWAPPESDPPDGRKKRKSKTPDAAANGNEAASSDPDTEMRAVEAASLPKSHPLEGGPLRKSDPLNDADYGNGGRSTPLRSGVRAGARRVEGSGVVYIQPVEASAPYRATDALPAAAFTGDHREKPRARPPDGGAATAPRAA